MIVSPARRAGTPWRSAVPLLTSSTLNPVNTSVIAVALVPIGRTFGVGPDHTIWLVASLYVVSAAAQPVVGLLVDRLGARLVLLVGTAATLVASLLALVPTSLGWLIGVRVVIGIGTCAGFPAALRVLHEGADGEVPGRMLALLSAASQTTAAIGPTVGGVLIAVFGWPAVFAINVPLTVLVLITTLLWVPRDRERDPAGDSEPVDLAGTALFVLAVSTLLVFLTSPGGGLRLILLVIGATALVVLVVIERRRPHAFLAPWLLRDHPALVRTYLRQALAFAVLYGVLFGLTQWLEAGRGLSEAATGLVILPLPVAAILASTVPGARTALRARLSLTAVLLVLGAGLLLVLDPATPIVVLLAVGAVFGTAQGLMNVANQKALYLTAPPDRVGQAAGLFRTAQFVGATAAGTVIAVCFGTHTDTNGLGRLAVVLIAPATVLLVITVADRRLSHLTLQKGVS